MPFCIDCGNQEPEGVAFCSSCGQSMTTSSTSASSNHPLRQNTVAQTRKDTIAEKVASAPAPLPIEVPPAATHLPADGRVAAQAPLPATQGKSSLPLKAIMLHLPARVRLPRRWGIVLALIVLMGGGGIWARLYLLAPSALAPSAYDQFVMKNGIQFGFDAQHSGFNPYESELSPATVATLVQAWTATNLTILSAPVVANGMLYVGAAYGRLYVFKADGCGKPTCSPLWTATTGNRGSINFSPAVFNGMVYVNSAPSLSARYSTLYAFKADGCGQSTCSPLWTATTDREISPPTVYNGIVYVDSSYSKPYALSYNKLYAFKADGCGKPTCSPLWTATIGDRSDFSPAVDNGIVYVGSGGGLYVFKADGCGQPTCSPLWTVAIPDDPPVMAKGVVYVTSEEDQTQATKSQNGNSQSGQSLGSLLGGSHYPIYHTKLSAFRATSCSHSTCLPLWTATVSGLIYASPAIANGVVYIGTSESKLYAFKADGCGQATCLPLWTATVSRFIYASPAIANGVVYIGTSDGKLYAFRADGCGQVTCLPLWTATVSGLISASPVVANGMLYVGTNSGMLYAFRRR